jgi:zinc transport system substrate-binding protein
MTRRFAAALLGLALLAEAAERIGGDAIVVIDLTPAGESPHRLELTTRQEREVLDADLAIVLGRGFQPDVERTAGRRDRDTLDVLDALDLPDRPDGSTGPRDPHVWLDPTIMGSIVTAMANAIDRVVPDERRAVETRAQRLVEADVRLDAQLTQALDSCDRTIIATQHEAFGWFAARYGFTNVGFDAVTPDDDPALDPDRVAAIEPLLDDGSVTTLFVEPLVPPSFLDVIADERGLETEYLDPYEGLSPRDEANDVTYRTVMNRNLHVLQDQMDCEVS